MTLESMPQTNEIARLKHETMRSINALKSRLDYQMKDLDLMDEKQLTELWEASDGASARFAELVKRESSETTN